MIVTVLAVLAVGLLAYIRLAPSDTARWHVDPRGAEDPGPGGALVVQQVDAAPQQVLERLSQVALAEPRVVLLAGDAEAGRITFVARSKLFGFPDYVTVAAVPAEAGTELTILSRLRFGGSDLGVNRARVTRWLAQL